MHRRSSYAGPATFPASGQPTQDETVLRRPAVAALHTWQSGVLNIADCERTEFVVALNEGESAGTRIETWPAEVRAFMDQHVTRWTVENKDTRAVHAITVAAPKYDGIQSCVTILHHNPTDFKESQRGPGGAAYIAPTIPAASGQRPQNKTHPQEPPGAPVHPWETAVLDLVNCERVEFTLALREGETAGPRVETWPPEVRAPIEQRVNRWVEQNKSTRSVRAMTMAAPKYDGIQHCVLILHLNPKSTTRA
jgi:hypothetical protein